MKSIQPPNLHQFCWRYGINMRIKKKYSITKPGKKENMESYFMKQYKIHLPKKQGKDYL